VPGAILAAVPDNTEGGAYLTIAFPLLLFIIIAAVLFIVLFARPHGRVPARRIAAVANAGPPSPEAAEAAAIAAGLPLAEGGGSAESGVEAAGAVSAALTEDPAALPEFASDEAAEGTPSAEGTPPSGETPPPEDTPPGEDTPPADGTGASS
jgi:hypothetical protein